jgi:type IV pilus assembly protein PilX
MRNPRMHSGTLRVPKAERGMALIIALIFLLLLTLVGLSSMQNSTLQEKMSSSVQFRNQSFQIAEAALRLGERAVSRNDFQLAPCGNACAPPSPPERAVPGRNNNVLWVQAGTDGLYAVQSLGIGKDALGCVNAGNAVQSTNIYRITSLGVAGNARTVLESIYATNCN